MAKLTRAQVKAHAEAQALLDSGRALDFEDRMQIIEDWHEGAAHSTASISAFFTPYELAMTMAVEVPHGRILDLCSGIGTLSVAVQTYHERNGPCEFTLVERDPAYCEVARRLMPDARIICGSVLDPDVIRRIGTGYDCVISNPPFGTMTDVKGKAPRYSGANAEYAMIDVASDLADMGVFILPQNAVPFRQSCDHNVIGDAAHVTGRYSRFVSDTGVELGHNMGLDCRFARDLWRGTKIAVEIAVCDFRDVQAARRGQAPGQLDLLAA